MIAKPAAPPFLHLDARSFPGGADREFKLVDVVLAFDVGSTRIKAAFVAADGQVVESARMPSPLGYGGCPAEQVWLILRRTAARLVASNRHVVRAVAVTGAARCHVLLDEDLAPLANVIPAAYVASAETATQVAQAYGANDGQHASIYHPLARLLELTRLNPNLRPRVRHLVELRDWLNFRLTGILRTDRLSFARLAPAQGGAMARAELAGVLQRLGLETSLIPQAQSPQAWLGAMTNRELPWTAVVSEGLVLTCSHDAWCASVGMGAVGVGHRYIESGTNETVAVVVDRPEQAPGLLTVPWGDALYQVGGPTQCGARSLRWAARKVLQVDPPGELIKLAQRGRKSSELPIFLPYVRGERTPLWRTAAPHGMYDRHGNDSAADIALATLVGVACANRYVFDRVPAYRGPVWIGGAMAAYDVWCQAKADVLGAPVRRVVDPHIAAVGAALAAWTALGRYPDLGSAQREAVRIDREFEPASDGRYESLYRRFVERLEGELRSGEFLRPNLEQELAPDYFRALHERVG
jgi:xylulokinase